MSLPRIKFILDAHLGKLAKYLRLLGFDSLFDPHYQDEEIIQCAESEDRIILTRDRLLLMNKRTAQGYGVKNIEPGKQLKEVVEYFNLLGKIKAFSRCLECNGELISIPKEQVEDFLPPKTNQYYQEFCSCPGCERIYWQGSHYEEMKRFIEKLKQEIANN